MRLSASVVLVLGMIVLSVQMMPSSASVTGLDLPCWEKMASCWNSTFNETTLLETTMPSFNASDVLCCSVLEEEVQTEKSCFCKGAAALVSEDASLANSLNDLLTICSFTENIHSICPDVPNGGHKITRTGLLSSLLIMFTYFIFY